MLVLTRKIQEAIKIDDEIEITVLSIDGEQVKLGVNAPKHVEIHRKEIYAAIQQENNNAAAADFSLLAQIKDFKK